MVSFNQSATWYCSLTPDEKNLAMVHRMFQKKGEFVSAKFLGKNICEERQAEFEAEWREFRENLGNCEVAGQNFRDGTRARAKALGLNVFNGEDFEKWLQYISTGIGYNPFNIPQVPAFNLRKLAFSFNSATNTINIGIGSKIQMDGYFLEVLENSVVARSYDGSLYDKGVPSATALNSLLRGIGVDASWGYDTRSKQITMNLLQKLGVDTSQPFFINDTQFEVQGDKIRTIGQTEKQEMQFWGFEGLNRLVARAYEQNLFMKSSLCFG